MFKFLAKALGLPLGAKKTPTFMEQLNELNYRINQQIWFKPDLVGFDTLKASLDLKEGDCEDFAAVKGLHLIKQGLFKGDELKPLVVRINWTNGKTEWHVVLVARNMYVFDNLSDEVYTINDLKNVKMNSGFYMPYTIWSDTIGGTRFRSKAVQDKYNKLFEDLFKKTSV